MQKETLMTKFLSHHFTLLLHYMLISHIFPQKLIPKKKFKSFQNPPQLFYKYQPKDPTFSPIIKYPFCMQIFPYHHFFLSMAPNTKLAPLMAILFMAMLVAAAVGCHASPPWTEERKAESRSSSSIMIMRKFGYSKRQMEHLRKLSSSNTARYIPGGPDSQHHSHPPRLP